MAVYTVQFIPSFEEVCFEYPAVERKELIEFLLLAGREVDPARQQQPALPLHQIPQPPALTEKLSPAHLINGLVGVLHDMELVIDDPAIRCVLLDAQSKRLPHIHTRRGDPHALMGTQFAHEELVERFLLPLPAKPQR